MSEPGSHPKAPLNPEGFATIRGGVGGWRIKRETERGQMEAVEGSLRGELTMGKKKQ